MTLFNLFVLMAAFGHPESDRIVQQGAIHPIDSLKMMEKVYIHTDRTCYYPGNDVWFKAYLINGSDRNLSGHSNNLHVELISPDSKIIVNRIIRLDAGLGNGDFKLPDELKPGRYRLRAYTNYMRNFNDQLFFNKEIVVINSTDAKDAIADEKEVVKNKIDISFFPEGGSLVDNVNSAVAFKAVNALGKGCDVSGKIYASTGALITTFKSVHLGMGSFFLRPVPGLSYYSVVKDTTGAEVRSEIPKSFPDGITLSATINQNNELLITTKTNAQTLPLVLDHDLLLTFSLRNVTFKTFSFKMKSYNNSFALPIDDLPDGIVMMTLSGPENLPLSERLIFIQKNNDLEVNIEPDKPVYKHRDSVEIRISFTTGSDIRQDAFLSLSAAEKSFTDHTSQYPSTISSWFLLESDIRGSIEEPSYYFDISNRNSTRDLDLLLLTQGWRDFEWKYNKGYFPPEAGFNISGSVTKNDVNKPLEVDSVHIALVENKNSFTATTPVDSSGKFRLEGIDLTGEARIIVSAARKKGRQQGLIILDSLNYKPEEVSVNQTRQMVLSEENVTAFKKIYETTEKQYKLSDTVSLGEISVTATRRKNFQTTRVENSRTLYNKPDAEILITPQFASYKNVFDILKGRVAGVIVTEGSGGRYVTIIRGQNSYSLTNIPLFLIDGIEKTYEEMIMLPVGLIDRIDVLKSAGETALFGVRGANGVIAVITRTGDVTLPSQPDNHSANMKITGYDEGRIFYSPIHSHSSVSENEPDLRTTLFWMPDITLQSNRTLFLNYFNADHSSAIKVILEGITSTGIPIAATTEYEVK